MSERRARIALEAVGNLGDRIGRTLLAERRLAELGLVGRVPHDDDRRIVELRDVAGWDAYVTDAQELTPSARRAWEAGVPVVLTVRDVAPPGEGGTIVEGADLRGLAAALVRDLLARQPETEKVRLAWTDPQGSPGGRTVAFPAPVGVRTGRAVDHGPIEGHPVDATLTDEADGWAGIRIDAGEVVWALADARRFVAPIVAASAALLAADGLYPTGIVLASAAGTDLVDRAIAAGVTLARKAAVSGR